MDFPVKLSAAHRLETGLRAFARGYDVALCDVWGVVHDGHEAHPGAGDALARFRSGGGTVVLITNAPRPRADIAVMLDGFGLQRDAWDAIVSSGDVTAGLVAKRGADPLYHLGPARDLPVFAAAQAISGIAPRRVTLEDAAYVVCTGLFRDDDPLEAYDAPLAAMKARSLPFVCANPDIVVHSGEELIYCAGALAERYAALGGPVTLIGKPHPLIYQTALAEAARLRGAPTPDGRILAIGDGIHTDILGASKQGFSSILVTSGIHRQALHADRIEDSRALDEAAYAKLVAEAGAAPTLLMRHLVW